MSRSNNQTYESTTGIKSEAGEVLWNELDRKDLNKFMRIVNKFRYELKMASTGLASHLVYGHFKGIVRGTARDTWKLNALNVIWNKEGP